MSSIKPNQNGTCKVCQKPFIKYRTTQRTCSAKCAIKEARGKTKKKSLEQKQLDRKMRELMKTKKDYEIELLKIVQEMARILDKDLPCIASGSFNGKMAGGHYYAAGSGPFTMLKFNMWNIHKQCFHSNSGKAGDTHRYRLGLIDRYGIEKLDEIESLRLVYKDLRWFKEDLRDIFIPKAKAIRKRLKSGIELTRDEINELIGIY